ncbi:MAG: tetratricopeptide repeat protein [Burkholderiales bacterium]|nr:tetratricopeptide repeat protein [Burkholderiales bacterium]
MLVLFAAVAQAADDQGAPARDARLEAARAAIAKKDWPAAQAVLKEALEANPGNADYHNLYAYAIRSAPNPQMDLVFKHYHEALRLDPKHRGAHEYIGEAYLMVGNLDKAREHLKALGRLCLLGCPEYTQLRRAIEEHERRQAKR